MKTVNISLSELIEDLTLYPRIEVSDIYISELVEALRGGAILPPIVADKTSKRIVDGVHRIRAYRRVFGDDYKTPIVLREYENEAAILEDAIRLNAGHGRRICRKDIVRCVHLGNQYGWTVEYVATLANLTVDKLTNLVAERTAYTQTGQPIVLAAGLGHLAGKKLTEKQRNANNRSDGNILFYAKRLADLVEANLIDMQNQNLVKELLRLKALLVEKLDNAA